MASSNLVGKVIGTCGHDLRGRGMAVEYYSEDCDAVEGFQPCIVYATYCDDCTVELLKQPEFISARSLAEGANTAGRQRPSKSHDAGSSPAGHAIHIPERLASASLDRLLKNFDDRFQLDWETHRIHRDEVRAVLYAVRELAEYRHTKQSQDETSCTCPSGDGSLRWPCPAHPPSTARRCHCGKFAMQTGMALITDEHAHDHVFDGMPCDCEDESACSAVEPSPEREPDQLCKRCRHSYAQHTKGLVVDDYCRHCACPGFVAYSPEKASDEGAI